MSELITLYTFIMCGLLGVTLRKAVYKKAVYVPSDRGSGLLGPDRVQQYLFPQRLGQSPAVCFHRAVMGLGLGLGLCSWDVNWVSVRIRLWGRAECHWKLLLEHMVSNTLCCPCLHVFGLHGCSSMTTPQGLNSVRLPLLFGSFVKMK